ncbi:MAG: MarR family winged helix-turn-helix transcriptional regulator [Granulosicoccus sp.]
MNKATAPLILEQFLPFRLSRLSESVSLKFAQHYKREFGMTRPEWRALAALGQLGTLTSTQICQHSNMHKTKVSRAVQALNKRGWLHRKRDTDDRRIEYLQLTPMGKRRYAKLVGLAHQFQSEVSSAMSSSELSTVNEALRILEERLVS